MFRINCSKHNSELKEITHCEVSFLEFFIELVNLLGILILVAFKIIFISTFFNTLLLLGEGDFFNLCLIVLGQGYYIDC